MLCSEAEQRSPKLSDVFHFSKRLKGKFIVDKYLQHGLNTRSTYAKKSKTGSRREKTFSAIKNRAHNLDR